MPVGRLVNVCVSQTKVWRKNNDGKRRQKDLNMALCSGLVTACGAFEGKRNSQWRSQKISFSQLQTLHHFLEITSISFQRYYVFLGVSHSGTYGRAFD